MRPGSRESEGAPAAWCGIGECSTIAATSYKSVPLRDDTSAARIRQRALVRFPCHRQLDRLETRFGKERAMFAGSDGTGADLAEALEATVRAARHQPYVVISEDLLRRARAL